MITINKTTLNIVGIVLYYTTKLTSVTKFHEINKNTYENSKVLARK